MPRALATLCILACLLAGTRSAQAAELSRADAALIDAAFKHAGEKGDAKVTLGALHLADALGSTASDEQLNSQLAAVRKDDSHAIALHEWLCWRRLPVFTARREAFLNDLTKLAKAVDAGSASSQWLAVLQLYHACLERDHEAVLAAAGRVKGAVAFPGRPADEATFELLQALGKTKEAAGLHVIAHRDFEALHALADLDRYLLRESQFLRAADRAKDADALLAVRDALRTGYDKASQHLVEKLFALNLMGRDKDRDALLEQTRLVREQFEALGGVNEAARRLATNELWTKLIEPMLKGDLAVLSQGAKLAQAIAADPNAPVRIEAGSSERQAEGMHYRGGVRVALGDIVITCDEATVAVVRDAKGRPVMTLTGRGKVTVAGQWGTANADRLAFVSDPAKFELAGNVRVESVQGDGKVNKLTAATLTLNGAITQRASLLDEFRKADNLDAKLALVPALGQVYEADELPGEARYLLALKLLEPHLSWYAPHATPRSKVELLRKLQSLEEQRKESQDRSRWEGAMGPTAWMKVPGEALTAAQESLAAAREGASERERRELNVPDAKLRELCYWRLRDPVHADVARTLDLLDGVEDQGVQHQARYWAQEIRRNNTVLTFDIPGGFGAGLEGPIVLDTRNADAVSFKLYRVRQPAQLQAVAERIGEDFLFRDYGLQQQLDPAQLMLRDRWHRDMLERWLIRRTLSPLPKFTDADLVQQWDVTVADLKWLGLSKHDGSPWDDSDDWRDYRDDDWFFNDGTEQHGDRLRKEYRPDRHEVSSWRTDRVVNIPAAALKEAGGYVLVATANGQAAHVPIIVEPLSVTLRRARDGVFVMASDATGRFPVIGAKVSAPRAMSDESTDRRGVAFLRVHAAGDRPIIVHKDGRYAIAGFGRVFDGLYQPWWENDTPDRLLREMKGQLKRLEPESVAQVYDDRFVLAAYTDRPTYRPGQQVRFKLIVRELPIAANQPGTSGAGFRAGDFDMADRLITPKAGKQARWEIINPRGRAVANGQGDLSDFGTAIGDAALTDEAAHGRYSLRITLDDQSHLVPDVFAVMSYRRPNFELNVEGVPATLTAAEAKAITLKLSGRYYFGLPVTDGRVNVRLVQPDHWQPLAEAEATLGTEGSATIQLMLPAKLSGGMYAVISTLTDASGRSVSVTSAMELRGRLDVAGTTNLPALPRFVAMGDDLVIRSPRDEITATLGDGDKIENQVFPTKDGSATIRLSRAGWHRIQSGEEAVDVFVYGGEGSPFASLPPSHGRAGQDENAQDEPGWVNLTDFALQEGTGSDRRDGSDHHLYALFERHHALAGDKLRVLIYCPVNQPRILLTIEGRSVIDYLDISLSAKAGRYQVVEIPIKAHYGPNFYLQGRILASLEVDSAPEKAARMKVAQREQVKEMNEADDRALDPRWCRVDVIDPNRKATGEKLNVSISTDKATYRPGEEVAARIVVTDLAGKPVETELSLAAVDESLFTFGEDSLGSLADALGQPVASRRYEPKAWRGSVGSRWSRAVLEVQEKQSVQLMQRMQESMKAMQQEMAKSVDAVESLAMLARLDRPAPLPLIEGKLPVTSIAMPVLRSDFRETAAWLPQLRTDAEGVATAKFTLPDSLTRYRLSAVGLTKGTDVGVGRARLRATLPLSVQVMLPRFAVEKDELRAVALLHNTTDQAKVCLVRWNIGGATVRTTDDEPYARADRKGEVELRREITVPARTTSRVTVWLTCDQVGEGYVQCGVTDRDQAGDRDAEWRTLAVSPLGRPGELMFGGTFRGEQRIDLPEGFVANDIRITASPNDLPHALQGLGYLVEYPHGCVEQTMSRFMPLVMVKHAAQKAASDMPLAAMANLPEALKQGLARLYNFQQEDGSWGWFQRDERDDAMTLYVAYGLVRCKATGTAVDAGVIDRACAFLQSRLREGKLKDADAARARYILALAGKAEKGDVRDFAQRLLAAKEEIVGDVLTNAALACRETGLSEQGERLWARARKWKANTTAEHSLKLIAQVTFGESIDGCEESVNDILAGRQGLRWAHTRDTAWAIEALAEFVAYAPPAKPAMKLGLTMNGRAMLEGDGPRHHLNERLPGPVDPGKGAVNFVLTADAKTPVHYSVTVTGVQRLDDARPVGDRVKLTRRYGTLDGKPVGEQMKVGQVIVAKVTLELAKDERYLLVEDRRPAALEFADDQLRGGPTAKASHVEFRDDRVTAFFASLPAGRHELVYYLRAETVGLSHVLPGIAYPMYQDKERGETATDRLRISP